MAKRNVAATRSFKVDMTRDEDGWWVASVAGFKGVHTQGRTQYQAWKRLAEVLKLTLASFDTSVAKPKKRRVAHG